MNSTAKKAEQADKIEIAGKAETLGRQLQEQSSSDESGNDGPRRGYHPKVPSKKENKRKFQEKDKVRIKGQAISVIYTIKRARQDPNTKLWMYKVEDKDGDVYEGSRAQNGYVAQADLKAEGEPGSSTA